MQICFIKENGKIFPAIVEGKSIRKDLREVDINHFYSEMGKRIEKIEKDGIMIDSFDTIIPVNPSKILCPALNFREHSSETKQKNPDFPYFFPKFPSTITSHNGHIIRPEGVQKLDYEGEIAVIIGKKIKNGNMEESKNSIGAYVVVNDVSARDLQNQFSPNLGKNWIMGKAADSFLPVSSTLYVGDEENFNIITEVNGEKRQDGNTDDMIFSFSQMIEYLSREITLYPGDMILSGTPSGVAASGKFPFLKDGDIVSVRSDLIGKIENRVYSSDS